MVHTLEWRHGDIAKCIVRLIARCPGHGRAAACPILMALGTETFNEPRTCTRTFSRSLRVEAVAHAASCRDHDLHVPDAPADPSNGSRVLPDLRHGARATDSTAD